MAFKVLHCFLVFLHRTAAFVLKVPRFLRLPVFGFFLREYSRYLPDFSFLIMLRWIFAHEEGSACEL